MRTYDLSPLYRSTVGFDRLASMLDNVLTNDVSTQTYPPYNIEKTGENAYRITVGGGGLHRGRAHHRVARRPACHFRQEGREDGERTTCTAASPPARSSGASSWPTMSARPAR